MTPFLVVETSTGKWWAMPATPGSDPERTARNFGYKVITHCATEEMAQEYITRKEFTAKK